jgi:pilus assembly protein CpaC
MNMLHSSPRRLLGALVVPALAAMLALGTPLATYAEENSIVVTSAAYGATRKVEINLNKSMIVDLPAGVAEVVVSQPTIVGAIMRTRTRAILQGLTSGDTNIFFLDDNGRAIQVFDVRVIEEPSQVGNALEDALSRVIPGSNIHVESVTLNDATNRVVLTGTVLSSADRDRAMQIATQFAGSPDNVANVIDVSGSQQVMLQVTVSEIRREVAKQLGINLSGSLSVGSVNLGFNNPMTSTPNGISGSFPIGNLQIDAAIRALENRNALRLLAQPTLTALSGEAAEFMVGGELAVPGFDSNGNQLYTYKPYGIELNFTPTVKSNGTISVQIDTGVSETQTGTYNLSRRDVKTTVELTSGTTIAIGGLLSQSSSQAVDQLPGLGDIPILGALFRSRDYLNQETELVILVTPYLVAPSPANTIALPTDSSRPATDAEAIFLGKLEHMYGVAGSGEMRGSISGSVGFVLD